MTSFVTFSGTPSDASRSRPYSRIVSSIP